MKEKFFCVLSGFTGASVAALLGGWTEAMSTLLIFMAIDYVTGLSVAFAGKSDKTENGKPSSKVGLIGLLRKGMMMLMLIVACRLDLLMNTVNFVRDGTCIAFILNETISIFENVSKFIDIPRILKDSVDKLLKKDDKEDKDDKDDKGDKK